MKLTFKGKSAIVTGACGGMGLEVCKNLSNNNILVLMIDIKEPPKSFLMRHKNCSYKKIDDTNFSFNLKQKPLESQKFVSRVGVSTITYSTTSTNSRGPIFRTKINFPGRGYTVLPRVIGFASAEGKDAIVKVSSISFIRRQ